MLDAPDELDKLVLEIRKTISDNRQFLEKLVDETVEDDDEDQEDEASTAEDFEEL
jgi:hypothetical protein